MAYTALFKNGKCILEPAAVKFTELPEYLKTPGSSKISIIGDCWELAGDLIVRKFPNAKKAIGLDQLPSSISMRSVPVMPRIRSFSQVTWSSPRRRRRKKSSITSWRWYHWRMCSLCCDINDGPRASELKFRIWRRQYNLAWCNYAPLENLPLRLGHHRRICSTSQTNTYSTKSLFRCANAVHP